MDVFIVMLIRFGNRKLDTGYWILDPRCSITGGENLFLLIKGELRGLYPRYMFPETGLGELGWGYTNLATSYIQNQASSIIYRDI